MPVDLLDIDAMLGRHPERDVGRGTADDLLAELDRVGIRTAIVSHSAAWLHDPATGNRWLLDATADHPRLRPCWVMLPDTCGEIEEAGEFVRAADNSGVVAVRAYPADHGYDLAGPDAAPLLDAVAEAGMPLLVDAGQADSRTVEAVASKNRWLRIIVCKPGYRTLRRWSGVLARQDNVSLSMAFLATHCGVEWLVTRFGAERVLFGTGTPEFDPAETVTRLLLSELSDLEVAAIGRTNALDLLGERGRRL